MEPRLGSELSRVRVHTDSDAVESSRLLAANAYTSGTDIFFASGKYQPHSDRGRALLAHELVHVVQEGIATGSEYVQFAAAGGAAAGPVREPAVQGQLSRNPDPRPEAEILWDLAELERMLADPGTSAEEARELELRRDYFLAELESARQAPYSEPSQETAQTEEPPREHASPVSARQTPREPPDTREYSGTQIEGEVEQLREQHAALPEADSDEREAIEQRLRALEPNLAMRDRLGEFSAAYARTIADMPLSIENRVAMAFGAGFVAGGLMELRPAETRRFLAETGEHPFAFAGGLHVGMTEGALVGLWDNVVGLVDLLMWMSPIYWGYRSASELVEYVRDPAGYEQRLAQTREQAQALMEGLGELLAEIATDPGFLVIHGEELGRALGQSAATWFNDDFSARSPYEKGETIGMLAGRIFIEIALLFVGPEEWAARGALAAEQTFRVSARLERAILAIMERIPALRRLLELRRAAQAAREAVQAERAVGAGVETVSDARRIAEATSTTRDVERVSEAASAPVASEIATDAERVGAQATVDSTRAASAGADVSEETSQIERWIDEAVADLPPEGSTPLDPATFSTGARPRVPTLSAVDVSDLTAVRRAELEAAYPGYVARREAEIAAGATRRAPLSMDEYVRARHGFETEQLRPGESLLPRDLSGGAIEQEAGRIMERVVDARLPGSANSRSFPNPFGDPCIPDHLPPGETTVFLDSAGRRASQGTPFSARFVGDSKYRDLVPISGQTRGFVNLARLSDTRTLVFYVRWQERFPGEAGLVLDAALGGRVLPVRPWNSQLVSPALREFARQRGVSIRLVTDIMWR